MSAALPAADTELDAIKTSLAAALTRRHVQRGLIDPAAADMEQLVDGIVCIVSEGGGGFANTYGREGQLGTMDVALIGFLKVDESTEPVAIEQAELALLQELLSWTGTATGVRSVLPQSFRQSQQLEHPYGWVTLGLKVMV